MAPMPLSELLTRMDRATAVHAQEQADQDEPARLAQLRQALAAEGQAVSETALQAAMADASTIPRVARVSSPPPADHGVVESWLLTGAVFAIALLVWGMARTPTPPPAPPVSTVSVAELQTVRAQQQLLVLQAQINRMQGDLNMGPASTPAEQRRRQAQQMTVALAQGLADGLNTDATPHR